MKKFFLSLIIIFSLFTYGASAMPFLGKFGRVEILTYHLISENSSDWSDYCISPADFENDLKYLVNSGYEFMTASQLAGADVKGRKIAVITFDDGYKSDLKYAVPLLEKYNACATFFVFGKAIDTPGYMSKEDLKSISESKCAEIGNHSYELHSKNPSTLSIMYKSSNYEKEILDDYEKNSSLLKDITGKQITALSYPNGIYSPSIDAKLKDKGVLITFSTNTLKYNGVKKGTAIGRKNRSVHSKIENLVR